MNTGAAASLPDYLLTLNSKTATAVGFTAAILFKPVDKLQFGASFRSESKFSFTGTATSNPATFPYPIDAQGHFIQLSYPTGDISAPLNTPPDLTVGVAWMPCEKWTITADYQWIGWSTYDSLKISFSTYKAPGTNTLVTKAIPRKPVAWSRIRRRRRKHLRQRLHVLAGRAAGFLLFLLDFA
jgi:long-subunit fatty acid transport protein